MKMQLVEYDVWGNAEEGFEVNNVFRTDAYYEIGDEDTKEDVVHKLKTVDQTWTSILETRIGPWLCEEAEVEVDLWDENYIEIVVAKTGEPLGRLEVVDETD